MSPNQSTTSWAMRALALCMFAGAAMAHMEMVDPPPFKSKHNPNSGQDIDYSMTSPLESSGQNYPCKGYHLSGNSQSVKTYTAGQTYSMQLGGTAVHGGGSCQLSLSYDNGASFNVIKSMIGGCPLTSEYSFTIPQNAPSGKALFAWSWFNKIGNREMYMNCAPVTIAGSGVGGGSVRANIVARASGLDTPEIYVANMQSQNSCTTKEGDEIVFPQPGKDVLYGGPYSGQIPTASSTNGCAAGGALGSTQNVSAAAAEPDQSPMEGEFKSANIGGTSGAAPVAAAAPVAENSESYEDSAPPPTLNTPAPASSPPVNAPAPSPTVAGLAGGCSVNGQIICGADGSTFSMCSNNELYAMGNVASGTICRNGEIVAS